MHGNLRVSFDGNTGRGQEMSSYQKGFSRTPLFANECI